MFALLLLRCKVVYNYDGKFFLKKFIFTIDIYSQMV